MQRRTDHTKGRGSTGPGPSDHRAQPGPGITKREPQDFNEVAQPFGNNPGPR